MNWYITVIKKYALFDGRSRRKEYWLFTLINQLILLALFAFDKAIGFKQPVFAQLYALATALPNIAVAVRRMHDTDHSGWWSLVPIANLLFLVSKGDAGENRFGSAP
jgi:uncharacterized membrane protein YhaH (DUF805 family)